MVLLEKAHLFVRFFEDLFYVQTLRTILQKRHILAAPAILCRESQSDPHSRQSRKRG
jgi:hypothetical protein